MSARPRFLPAIPISGGRDALKDEYDRSGGRAGKTKEKGYSRNADGVVVYG